MDARTVFKMAMLAIANPSTESTNLLYDALEDCHLSEEADKCRLVMQFMTHWAGNYASDYVKLIVKNISEKSKRSWSYTIRKSVIHIGSPMNRRVAIRGGMTRRYLSDEDYKFLVSVFRGKWGCFVIGEDTVKIPCYPIYLRYALDLSAGIERLNPIHKDSFLIAVMSFSFQDVPHQPAILDSNYVR